MFSSGPICSYISFMWQTIMGKRLLISVHVHGIMRPFLFADIANTPCFLCNLLLSGLCKLKPGHTKWFIYILWVTKVVDMSGQSVAQILMSDFLLLGLHEGKTTQGNLIQQLNSEPWSCQCVTQVPVFAFWRS